LLSFVRTFCIALTRDIKSTVRIWRLNSGSTLASYAALAVSIGAATSVFSVISSLLLVPLPLADESHVVRITALDRNNNPARLSLPDVLDLKRRLQSADTFGFYTDRNGNLGGGSRPALVHMLEIDSALFQVLGIKMAQGRALPSAANQPGHECMAVISWQLWKARFDGAPMTDRFIRLNEKPCQITGVLPEHLDIPVDADLWIAKAFDLTIAANGRGFHSYYGMAHLKRTVSIAAFNAELNRIAGQLAMENPATDSGLRLQAVTLRTVISGNIKPALLILFIAVTAVLLMACANVANLMLAKVSARMPGIAVRVAIGATRASLLRQVLTESLLLALVSSLTGLGLSVLFVRWLRSLPSSTVPRPESILVDWRVAAFAVLVAAITGLIFGALPALKVSSAASFSAISGLLSQAGGRVTESRPQQLTRQVLMAGETAMATILLAASLLLLRSFNEVLKLQPGFQTDHLLTAYVSLNPDRYRYTIDYSRFAQTVIEKLKAKPGIVAAAFTTSIPWQGGTSGRGSVQIEGRPLPVRAGDAPVVMNTGVSPGFRETLRIPLKAGVDLTERDDREDATAILVNQTFARIFFPNESAVRKRIRYPAGANDNSPWQQIAGVIGDVRQTGPEAPVLPEFYRPLSRTTNSYLGIVIRTSDKPLSHLHDLETAVLETDAELPIFYPRTMEQVAGRRLGTRTFLATMITGFACVAFLLAGGGIFAVIGYSVSMRTSEMGVRMAFGATQADLLRMILRQGLTPAFIGIAIGLAASLLLNQYLVALLYGVAPTDLVSYAAPVLLLGLSSTLAALIPARRAALIEPWKALRNE
jgi:putative ABC transport system permease protein